MVHVPRILFSGAKDVRYSVTRGLFYMAEDSP